MLGFPNIMCHKNEYKYLQHLCNCILSSVQSALSSKYSVKRQTGFSAIQHFNLFLNLVNSSILFLSGRALNILKPKIGRLSFFLLCQHILLITSVGGVMILTSGERRHIDVYVV